MHLHSQQALKISLPDILHQPLSNGIGGAIQTFVRLCGLTKNQGFCNLLPAGMRCNSCGFNRQVQDAILPDSRFPIIKLGILQTVSQEYYKAWPR